LKWLIFKFTT